MQLWLMPAGVIDRRFIILGLFYLDPSRDACVKQSHTFVVLTPDIVGQLEVIYLLMKELLSTIQTTTSLPSACSQNQIADDSVFGYFVTAL